MGTPAIDLNGVSKQFGPITALQDLDLTVRSGEVYGFLGPNGAGKSTTINILLDFVRPTSGNAEVLGLDARQESLRIREQTGVLPENFAVYGRLTGRQHVEFAADSKDVEVDPDKLLDRVNILEAAERKAGGYSKGMKQRLALAMALVGEPELLVLDEPSTGLDPNGAREMREIILEERDRGTTIFFSSHILEQVEAVCDRVGILRRGELVAEDTIEGLRDAAGEGATLRVSVSGDVEGAATAARNVDGVDDVTVRQDAVVVSTKGAAKTAVLDAIENAGYDILDFSTEETSLEDLFATYTEGDR
ncbi:MAG: ATP-binding cassette domain-containing protein [Halobacteriaceae archaeon]